jgi:hypothetical protein
VAEHGQEHVFALLSPAQVGGLGFGGWQGATGRLNGLATAIIFELIIPIN